MAEPLNIEVTAPRQLENLPRWLRSFVPRYANRKMNAANQDMGRFFLKEVRLNSVRRPGPRRVTGQYVEAWRLTTSTKGGLLTVNISNPSPQWRRLEYGFVGSDALGRHYNQAPRPHIRVAREATVRRGRVVYGKAIQEAWKDALKDL